MQLFIREFHGIRNLTLEVQPGVTIKQIKALITTKSGINPKAQSFIFPKSAGPVDDSADVWSLCEQNFETCHLILRISETLCVVCGNKPETPSQCHTCRFCGQLRCPACIGLVTKIRSHFDSEYRGHQTKKEYRDCCVFCVDRAKESGSFNKCSNCHDQFLVIPSTGGGSCVRCKSYLCQECCDRPSEKEKRFHSCS